MTAGTVEGFAAAWDRFDALPELAGRADAATPAHGELEDRLGRPAQVAFHSDVPPAE